MAKTKTDDDGLLPIRYGRKGAIIERVEHPKTRRQGIVRLDKKGGMIFFARVVDGDLTSQGVESSDGRAVRVWLRGKLATTPETDLLDWLPVIEVSHGGNARHYWRDESREQFMESLKIEIARYYVALTLDGVEWRRLKWEQCDPNSPTCVPPAERWAASGYYHMGPKHRDARAGRGAVFRLPYVARDNDVVLAYDEHLWLGLRGIVEQVKGARDALALLLTTKQGIARLTLAGKESAPLLLAAPEVSRG